MLVVAGIFVNASTSPVLVAGVSVVLCRYWGEVSDWHLQQPWLAALPESVQIKVAFVSKKVESECEKTEQSRKAAWRGTVKDC